jgi:hypothetical protein
MMQHAQPWRSRQESPNPQIRDAADQYEAARRLLVTEAPGSGVLLPLINVAAMAIELYLKSLSSQSVHIPVEDFPGLSKVTATPSLRGPKGHKLVALLDKCQNDLIRELEAGFRTEYSGEGNLSLREALEQCEGAFAASRYPFDHGMNLSNHPFRILMATSEFLTKFVGKLPHRERIEWN